MLKDVVVILVDDKPVAIAELRQMTPEQIDAFKETCRLNREALKKQEESKWNEKERKINRLKDELDTAIETAQEIVNQIDEKLEQSHNSIKALIEEEEL